MATTKTRKKKTTKAERRAIALRNLKKARAAVKKKTAKKPAKKTAKRSTAKKSAKRSTAKKSALAPMKRGSGYSQINTLTLTEAQATQLGKLMRSHRCTGKGKRTVCTTKTGKVVAVINSNR